MPRLFFLPMIAQIATDTSIDRTFDYAIPKCLMDAVRPGIRVRVEFGKRVIEGFVLSLSETSSHNGSLKQIMDVVGGTPLLSDSHIKLATWMASYYIAPIESCIRAMLPAPVRKSSSGFKMRLIVEATSAWQSPDPATILSSGKKATARQLEILEMILRAGAVNLSAFCRQWNVAPATLRKMETDGMVTITEQAERRDPLAGRNILPSKPLSLTEEQQVAKKLICDAGNTPDDAPAPLPILLHGVTASGKTEVYLQSIASCLEVGKGAIVLVPEISLTPQTIQRFASRFGETIAVLHSQLGDGERHDEWHRIQKGKARVVVGPRSAVFAPVEKLGVIIVDEEHEPSYKQEESPRYNARDVAVMRANIEHCTVVLGSATPSLESWYNVQNGKYRLASMTRRAVDMTMPRTEIVDMRAEVAKTGMLPVFSERLISAMKARLQNGEQVMLFLNRRGYAPHVICGKCGHTERCEDCSIGMTYHAADDIMRCHICGDFRKVPMRCPECGNQEYKYSGIGTQRVETIARKIFPKASIQRMDADVTSRKYSHQEILDRFRARKIDILIGTQMIAKGLDFPNVTLAGILNADSGLSMPDLRASERTFQLIAQMAGRSGRGSTQGDVLVQTLSPEHPAILYAKTEDYIGFAENELAERRELSYPPYTRFICITFKGEDESAVHEYARRFQNAVGQSAHYRIGDPCLAPLEKIKKNWRYQITIFGEKIGFMSKRIRAAALAAPPPPAIHLAIDIDCLNSL